LISTEQIAKNVLESINKAIRTLNDRFKNIIDEARKLKEEFEEDYRAIIERKKSLIKKKPIKWRENQKRVIQKFR
jgi:hypothetical protein